MNLTSIPDLVTRLIEINGGDAAAAAEQIGTSAASLSRWRNGNAQPRERLENRLRAIVDGPGILIAPTKHSAENDRLERLENTISATIHALREEFHRTAPISARQEVLDFVSVLFFAHVISMDSGTAGMGEHLRAPAESSVSALNRFMTTILNEHLPVRNGEGTSSSRLTLDRFYAPLSESDETFARNLLRIFERDAAAFRELHQVGRDDLINEVFSRFMSTSFIDEKEMGQYLTPPEIVRFMVQLGVGLEPRSRRRLLNSTLTLVQN